MVQFRNIFSLSHDVNSSVHIHIVHCFMARGMQNYRLFTSKKIFGIYLLVKLVGTDLIELIFWSYRDFTLLLSTGANYFLTKQKINGLKYCIWHIFTETQIVVNV